MATPSAVVYFEYTTTRVSSDHNSHTFCYFVFVFLKRYLFCCLWWVGLSFLCCTLSCSVLSRICVQSGRVQMEYGGGDNYACSKCTLSPSLWPRLPLLCILNIRQLEFHRITILTRFVIFVFVFLKRYLFCCLWWVGLSFLCCTLSCSVLCRICVQSGRVQMEYGGGDNYAYSKCTLSPSLWPRLPLLCLLNIRQLEFHRITILTRFVLFVFVFLKRYLFCCLWWVGLSFSLLHPLLQCFVSHLRSIQDVSKWNTGAVTNMSYSKCTRSLSPSLWPRRLPLWCVLLNTCIFDHSRVRRVTRLTRVVLFVCLCVMKRYSFVVVCGGLASSFSLLHPSLAVFGSAPCVQFRTCPNGIRGR